MALKMPLNFILLAAVMLGASAVAPAGDLYKERTVRDPQFIGSVKDFSDDDLKNFTDPPRVSALYLDHSKISDAGIKYLKQMRALDTLYLSDTAVTDAGLNEFELQSHPKLHALYIGGAEITDKGLEKLQLRSFPELEILRIGAPRMTAEGEKIGPSRVTDAGMAYVARLTSLRDLSLSNQITDAGLKNLLPLDRLMRLNLGENNHITDAGMAYLGQFRSLSLDVGSNRITDASLTRLARLKSLGGFAIRSNQITDAGVKALSGRGFFGPALISDQITDDGLKYLQGTTLHELEIGGPKVTDRGLRYLQGQEWLSFLNLSKNSIKGEGLSYLVKLPHLKFLGLSDVTDSELAYVAQLQHLEVLFVFRPKFTEAGLVHLKNLKELKCVDSLPAPDNLERLQEILPRCPLTEANAPQWNKMCTPSAPK